MIRGKVEPEPADTCAVCQQPRRPEVAGPYCSAALADPFCSTECCQSFYGLETTTIGEKRKRRAVNGAKALSSADAGDVYREQRGARGATLAERP